MESYFPLYLSLENISPMPTSLLTLVTKSVSVSSIILIVIHNFQLGKQFVSLCQDICLTTTGFSVLSVFLHGQYNILTEVGVDCTNTLAKTYNPNRENCLSHYLSSTKGCPLWTPTKLCCTSSLSESQRCKHIIQ